MTRASRQKHDVEAMLDLEEENASSTGIARGLPPDGEEPRVV